MKKARDDVGQSQPELAALLNVTSQTVGNWETGRRRKDELPWAVLRDWAKYTNVEETWLLFGDEAIVAGRAKELLARMERKLDRLLEPARQPLSVEDFVPIVVEILEGRGQASEGDQRAS
jgi:transcriptional regulator with XRE-family HTH domain